KDISVHAAIKCLEDNPYIKYADYNYIYQLEDEPEETDTSVFTDVKSGKYYSEAVNELYKLGIVKGVSKDQFAPEAVTTRAMMAEILYRIDTMFGRNFVDAVKPEGYQPFTDVKGKWYWGAADWARLTGVVRGYPDGAFRGDRPITRAEAATMLYRYFKFAGLDPSNAEGRDVMRFNDGNKIPSWAKEAVNYLWKKGMMVGVSEESFDPKGMMNRAMIATVAYRVVKEFEKQEAEPVVTEPVPVESLFYLNGEKYGRLIASSESAEDAVRVCTRHFTDLRYEGYHNIVTDCSVIYESDILYGLNVKWKGGKGNYEENVISIKKNIADISVNNVAYGDKDSFRILTDSKEQIEKVLLYLLSYKYSDLTLSNGYELAENDSEYILNADTMMIVGGDWGLEDTYHYYNVTLTLDKTTRYVECQKQEISHH
ncbi:MAG: S-layer homology domain-containing protein, partial [Clostridia bacterium]|nr:S-layer homology domain-containing protein [Clostridia bacterium]